MMREMNLSEDTCTMDNVLLAAGRLSAYGMKIVESQYVQPVPKIQMASNFEWCSDEFRQDMNNWLLKRFGTKCVAYMLGKDTIVMHPSHARQLRIECAP